MSLSEKELLKLYVDSVEKVDFILNWISSTLTFWDLDKTWPGNLIKDSCEEAINILKILDKDIL